MSGAEEVSVWDRTTRIFHWLNVLCVLGLIAIGTVILFAGDLGVSNDGKILLKTTHVWVGYVFFINLAWRLVWGFVGGRYARWSAVLPFSSGYGAELRAHLDGLAHRRRDVSLGHNALGRLGVTLLLIALVVQGSSGLVLAGTDVYMPPFGGYFSEWVARPDLGPEAVRPYAPDTVDPDAYKEMRGLRAPFIDTHLVGFYVLLSLIALHVLGVVMTEVRSGGGRVSAMITGKKTVVASVESNGVD
jgi:cytochrome b